MISFWIFSRVVGELLFKLGVAQYLGVGLQRVRYLLLLGWRERLQRVVFQHHLQVDRQDDHRAAQGDLLEHLPGNAGLEDLIARGGKMHEHQVRDAQVQEREFRQYVQHAVGSQSSADQLAKLADLRDRGVITAEEFDREKAKILA
jgi:hypothetical protein